jgi:hypothetical protein
MAELQIVTLCHKLSSIFFVQPTYKKINEVLFLDNPLHVILNKSKLAYRIYVILIANKELKTFFEKENMLTVFNNIIRRILAEKEFEKTEWEAKNL